MQFLKSSPLVKILFFIFLCATAKTGQAAICVVNTATDVLSADYSGSSIRTQFNSISNEGDRDCEFNNKYLDNGENPETGIVGSIVSSTCVGTSCDRRFPDRWILPNTSIYNDDSINVDKIVFKEALVLDVIKFTLFGAPSPYVANAVTDTNQLLDRNNEDRDATYSSNAVSLLEETGDLGTIVLDFRTNFKNVDFNLLSDESETETDGSTHPKAPTFGGDGSNGHHDAEIDWSKFPLRCSDDSKKVALWNTVILLPDSFFARYRNNSATLKKIIFDHNRPETSCLRDFGAVYVCIGEKIGDPNNTEKNDSISDQNASWCQANLRQIDIPLLINQPSFGDRYDFYWPDDDQDGYGDEDSSVIMVDEGDPAPTGTVNNNSDCDDHNSGMFPGNTEVCDGLDNDCDGTVDLNPADGTELCPRTYYDDLDGDGHGDPDSAHDTTTPDADDVVIHDDCDDTNSAVHPGSIEICDGLDNDCDGTTDISPVDGSSLCTTTYYTDVDGDGYGDDSTAHTVPGVGDVEIGGDCDDTNASVNPSGTEVCDGLDNDCNGSVDTSATDGSSICTEYYKDIDGDGFGDDGTADTTLDPGDVEIGGDCNDADAGINPGAAEICGNTVDENCDGTIEGACAIYYDDLDGDGYGDDNTGHETQDADDVTTAGDCDDTDSTVNPAAAEECSNAVDDNCDGVVDENCSIYYDDLDDDGYGDDNTGHTTQDDDDVTTGGDCDDSNASINPGAAEICPANGIDENCDGTADESCGVEVCDDTIDNDGNGLQDCDDVGVCDCTDLDGDGFTVTDGDCDDSNADVHPGATEFCNLDNIDYDCDGVVNDNNICIDPDFNPLPSGSVDGDGFVVADGARAFGCSLQTSRVQNAGGSLAQMLMAALAVTWCFSKRRQAIS